ncbi:hypothetical protein [Pseudemcibacter aquimaris]|uniref:hypothetical protein n=1 Tax=Pseudemcibacter aquimaris TaxID=2857064 RepID=UPI002012732A|nr:hypothetical protein [Pseudemcibacter aquimaris]MCC3862378.1 hypothetical protein [Pseudemcibacter aquimaris]WDU59191.1 hypothetical protein KW060_02775 [Pseudemcibacter aquimaris]
MKENNNSKIFVIGFVLFVIITYTASFFYTRDKNDMLLSAPRLVLLIGNEQSVNAEFSPLSIEDRRNKIRSIAQLGLIQTISQINYDNGETDIAEKYKDVINGGEFAVADCLEYSELIKRTMARDAKTALKASWIFSACGIIE